MEETSPYLIREQTVTSLTCEAVTGAILTSSTVNHLPTIPYPAPDQIVPSIFVFDPALLAQDPPFLAALSLPQMVPLAVVIVEQDQASPLYPAPNQIGLSTC